MGVVTSLGSRIMTGLAVEPITFAQSGMGDARVRVWVETVEVGSADSATSTYLMARIPSHARILGMSKLHFDDLASTGSPTIDIGIFTVRSGDFTDDDDALNDGIDVATAASSAAVIKDIANYGKHAWEFINGQSTDPNCAVYIKLTLKDAAVNVGGTVTLELYYTDV